MAFGDTFSAVQDASLKEKAMRDQNINAAFSRMMAAKQFDAQQNIAQQQLALEHEKLKASMMTAAMAHDQQTRHNNILEKQVDGYLDLQRRQVDRQHEADDHMGDTIANNLHELTGEADKSKAAYDSASTQYRQYELNIDRLVGLGKLVKDKQSGLYKATTPENEDTAQYANKRLTDAATALDNAKKKYEFDAQNHAHAVNFATQKGFMIDHKTGAVIDMVRGKKFAPAVDTDEAPSDTKNVWQMPQQVDDETGGSSSTTNEAGFLQGDAASYSPALQFTPEDQTGSNAPQAGQPISGPTPEYKAQVKDAFQKGKVSREQARQMLLNPQ